MSLDRIVAIVLLLTPITAVNAQGTQPMCTNGPFEKEVVDSGDPIYLQLCSPAPPCFQPSAPTLLSGDWVRGQSLTLEADTGSGQFDATAWQAFSPSLELLWEHTSLEAVGPGSIRFGAPGLELASDHRFRVAFRRALDGRWTCWSEFSNLLPTSGSLSGSGPAPPAGTSTLIEDEFRRPTTLPKNSSTGVVGDGLGPNDVWSADFGQFNSPNIHSSEQEAFIEKASFVAYRGRTAEDPHSFAETTVIPYIPIKPGGYNIGVLARYQTGPRKFYQAKFFDKWLTPCGPTIVIFDHLEASGVPSFGDDLPLSEGQTCNTCTEILQNAPSAHCEQLPGATAPDLSTGNVWFRIEVDDDGIGDTPVIEASMIDCSGGTCATFMTATREDLTDLGGLAGNLGSWAFEGHDERYLMPIFRAGSE